MTNKLWKLIEAGFVWFLAAVFVLGFLAAMCGG